jgi:uncharacterized protein HemX
MSSTATASRTVTLETRTTSTATAERVTVTSSPAPAEKPIAAIAGGAAGGGVGLAIIIGLLIYYICHAKKSRDKHKDEVEQRLSGATLTKDNPTDNKTSPISRKPNSNLPPSH